MQDLYVVILAAGKGVRMQSELPKVLHSIAGKPMLQRVIETAQQLNPQNINVVVGHAKELLFNSIDAPVNWVIQQEQLGTGHAVKMALANIPLTGKTLVLYGDVPLINAATLNNLIALAQEEEDVAVLIDELIDPSGYGRIIRDTQQQIIAIVEEKDTTTAQKQLKEINTGIYVIPNKYLHQWLNQLSNHNAQQEYYLTDIVALANQAKVPVKALKVSKSYLAAGVNNKIQLAGLERIFQLEQSKQLLSQGLILLDPNRFDLRGELIFGQDVVIDVNTVFEGVNRLGNGVSIGAHCVFKNVRIADNVIILPFSHLENCEVGAGAKIGPYARIRPQTKLAAKVHIGNFVEVKKSIIGEGSKINHLSYIGDSIIGQQSNIGAGTITCNYDGVNKYQTVIGDECRVGSGTMLVAPVTVENKATIGAGSVITKVCAADKLTLSRVKQKTIVSWQRPEKSSKE